MAPFARRRTAGTRMPALYSQYPMRAASRPANKLTLLTLAAATFFMVSGGPNGLEEIVSDCGYRVALAIIVLLPLVWSLPTGLMVGELSAAIPAEGGFYVWVMRALGPFWGFQESWLSLASSIFDMAAYPTVFVLTLGKIWAPATQGQNGLFIGASMILACLAWNLFGAKSVGQSSVLLGILLLTPFALITAYALSHGRLQTAQSSVPGHRDLLAGILVAMWNYMGWDNASTVAGEVETAQRTYPRVMMLALAAIVICYVIPISAVWRTHLQASYWTTGSWSAIATLLGGPWLGAAVIVANMISTFGIVNSLMMSYSRLPYAMAEAGQAPRVLARTRANGAPWVSLCLCALAWMAALGFTFDRLLMLDILLYGASLVLEFIALAALRMNEPALPRPFRVPGAVTGAAVLGVGPTALLIVALIRDHREQLGSISALTLGLVLMAVGPVLYYAMGRVRR